MSQNNIQIDKLTCEQRQQFFLALFNNEPSLLNVLNTEQRQKLYTALMTIDPSLKSLNAHSTIYGTTNEQACFKLFLQIFRSAMNPIKIQEFKQIKNDFQWHELLKLDKDQYLNFRNDLRNRAASRLSRGESVSRQQKGKVEEVIRDFKEANPTFPVSEADFILREWLALYCNSMVDQAKKKKIAEAKKHGLPPPPPKRKNVQPPKKHNSMDNNRTTTTESSQDSERVTPPSSTSSTDAPLAITPQVNAPTATETMVFTFSTNESNAPVVTNISSTSEVNIPATTEFAVETPGKKGRGKRKKEVSQQKQTSTRQTRSRLANKEIVDAQLKLGDCFYNGIGTKLDITQAKYWYEKAANNGSIIAKNNLKDYYNEKIRFEIDKHKKIKFYYKMIFSIKRLTQFGLYHINKIFLKTNYDKSVYYLQKAAENGCKFAQFNLGGCYQLGHGVRKDIRKAFELYKKSAKQEYINAQSQLIYCYEYGLGTEINRVKALELVKIMAEKGFKHAQYLLGLHYITGEGVDKDEIKAFKLFEKLAKESKKCQSNNNKINEQKDFEYFKILMKYVNSNSLYQLGYCYDKGVGTELNLTKAFELYKTAAEKGHNVAQNVLGYSYENGIRIEKDLKQAIYWYSKAAGNGYDKAQYNLGRCYKNGNGVEKDEKKAFESWNRN
ncbi:Sel1 repeat protein [Rhizophagus irregularis DAOM 181602=DAOM 197198]|nr:Sel1 repeat protein [Rhizophagus irregularis DAOM 181602=DAOM 197198]